MFGNEKTWLSDDEKVLAHDHDGDPSGAGAIEARAWLAGAELDADIAVPSVGEGWSAMATLGLEATHHLVQVDPTPALAEAGTNATAVSADALAAAAAGVLAGRIAAGNRRWRAALEP